MEITHGPHASRLRQKEAAHYLAALQSWLEKAAVTGNGPPFLRLSPRLVVYDVDDLDLWAKRHRVQSTAAPS